MPDEPEKSDTTKPAAEPKPEPKKETEKPLPEQVEQHPTGITEEVLKTLFGEHETRINARLDGFEKRLPAEKKEGTDGLQKESKAEPTGAKPEGEPKPKPQGKKPWRLWRTV